MFSVRIRGFHLINESYMTTSACRPLKLKGCTSAPAPAMQSAEQDFLHALLFNHVESKPNFLFLQRKLPFGWGLVHLSVSVLVVQFKEYMDKFSKVRAHSYTLYFF